MLSISRIIAFTAFVYLTAAAAIVLLIFTPLYGFIPTLFGHSPADPGFCICTITTVPGLAPIYVSSISALTFGVSFLLYERKFGFRGFGFLMMVAGLFDLVEWHSLNFAADPYRFIQIALVLGGWVVAGRPKPVFDWWVVALPTAVYVSGVDYHFFTMSLLVAFYNLRNFRPPYHPNR